jgi:mannitol/fructose-specific phosphotransferase system IIA component
MSFGFFGKKEKQRFSGVRSGQATVANSAQNNGSDVLVLENILVGQRNVTKYEAIEMAGQLLVDGGYVMPEYINAMKEREDDLTTYIGNGIAIPHGIGAAKEKILKTGISIIQYPEGIVFEEGKIAYLVIGIAGKGNEHLKILSNLAEFILEEAVLEELFKTEDVGKIYSAFTNKL